MRSLSFSAAVIVAALVLAGCGGAAVDKSTGQRPEESAPASSTPASSNAGNSSKIIDPSDLLSAAEASQVIGKEMIKKTECTDNAVVGQKICIYDSKVDETFTPYLQISLVQDAFFSDKTPGATKELYLNTKKMMDKAQPVQLGEDAYYSGTDFPSLNVLHKGYAITIIAGYVPKDKENKAVAVAAAQIAVKNLDKKLG